jgi:small-conductance mechanosensitive channel
MILPLNYFIEKPFQNWTRESASIIGTVMIYLDYRAPVDVIRARAEEIAKNSALHDGRVFNLAVTDFKEQTMEVRILISAADASRAFDLRCEMRESIIAFLRERYPEALPVTRLDAQGQPAPAQASS